MKHDLRLFLRSFPWATYGRLENSEEFLSKHQQQCARVSLLKNHPRVTLLLTGCDAAGLSQTVSSVLAQSYPDWELLILSPSPQENQEMIPSDPRIKYLGSPGGTRARAKNQALRSATGDWVGVLEAGDILSPVALFSLLAEAEHHLEAEWIFSNEASFDLKKGKVFDFISKPLLHWFNLLHFDVVGKCWLVKSSVLHALNLFNEGLQSEEDYDLFHRLDLQGSPSLHVPMYLYYRASKGRSDLAEKRLIVETSLKKRGLDGFVQTVENGMDVQPILKEPKEHRVSVIMLFKDKPHLTLKALEHLDRQKGQIPLEVILVNNGSRKECEQKVAAHLQKMEMKVKLVDYLGPFNFGHMNNWAIRHHATGDLLLLLNNDVFLTGENQIDLMASWAEKEWVGTVGIRLHYEHGAIQHSGLDARFGGNGRLVRVGNGNRKDTFAFLNHLVFGNTFACCMLKRSTFQELGEFREVDLANGFGDIAFNLECVKRGLKNVYLGTLQGTHLESVSRGLNYEYWEECVLEREYPELLQQMLREDLAVNRVPESDSQFMGLLRDKLVQEFRMRAPWLKTVKRAVEKNLQLFKKKYPLEA